MDFRMKGSGNAGVLTLVGDLTIHRASELRETLSKSLERADQVLLDLETVTDVDISFLQLLCSAHRTAVKSDKQFSIKGDFPEIVEQLLADAGYLRHMGCVPSCLFVRGV